MTERPPIKKSPEALEAEREAKQATEAVRKGEETKLLALLVRDGEAHATLDEVRNSREQIDFMSSAADIAKGSQGVHMLFGKSNPGTGKTEYRQIFDLPQARYLKEPDFIGAIPLSGGDEKILKRDGDFSVWFSKHEPDGTPIPPKVWAETTASGTTPAAVVAAGPGGTGVGKKAK